MLSERYDLFKTQWLTVFLYVGLLASCVIVYLTKLWSGVPPQDEGILLIYPDLILRGYSPYRDFAALYTPGTFYVIAGAFELFGSSLIVERAIGVGYWLLLVSAMYAFGRPLSPRVALLAGTACLVGLRFFDYGAYAIVAAQAAAVIALVLLAAASEQTIKRAWYLCALSGAAAGLAVCFRQDIGAVSFSTLFLLCLGPARKQLSAYLLGWSLVTLPVLLLFWHLGIERVFDNLILDVFRNGQGRRLPIVPTLGLIALLVFVTVNVVGAVVALVNKFAPKQLIMCCGAASYSLGMLPSVLQRADRWHICYALGLVAGLAVVSSAFLMRFYSPQFSLSRNFYKWALALWSVLMLLQGQALLNKWHAPIPYVISGERWVIEPNTSYRAALQALVNEMNKLPGGYKLFVGPNDLRFAIANDCYLYFLWPHLTPVTRYIEMNPGVANRNGSGIATQLGQADVLVLTSKYDKPNEPNVSAVPGSDLANKVVSERFSVYKQFGPWTILLSKL